MAKKHKVGDVVLVKVRRHASGATMYSTDCEAYKACPVEKCVIHMVGVVGCPDLFALNWADNGQPVGLPFRETDFLKS